MKAPAEERKPFQEKPKAMASLPISEPKPVHKPESKANKVIPLPNYQQIVKERLAKNGFSDLKVTQDGKNRLTISGTVKSQSQKDKVIKVVSAEGLSMPVDYKLAVASDRRPKPALSPQPLRPRDVLGEGKPLPHKEALETPREVQMKPLPPRLD